MGKNDLSAFPRIPEVDCLSVVDVAEEHLLEGLRLVKETAAKGPKTTEISAKSSTGRISMP
jgi:hypothetical protein